MLARASVALVAVLIQSMPVRAEADAGRWYIGTRHESLGVITFVHVLDTSDRLWLRCKAGEMRLGFTVSRSTALASESLPTLSLVFDNTDTWHRAFTRLGPTDELFVDADVAKPIVERMLGTSELSVHTQSTPIWKVTFSMRELVGLTLPFTKTCGLPPPA